TACTTSPRRETSADNRCKRCFFFQAEDGIRDGHVTGVQTCALPICAARRKSECRRDEPPRRNFERPQHRREDDQQWPQRPARGRSEERRVGKECRSRGSAYHEKKDVQMVD